MTVWLKRLFYFLILLASLSGTILMTMPVQFIAVQFGLPESVRVGHLSGTVWAGSAVDVAYLGPVGKLAAKDRKMDLAWKWCPGWKQGPAAACLTVDSPLLKGEGTFAYSVLGNGLTVSDARFLARVQAYPVEIGSFRSSLAGEGEINVESLSVDFKDARLLTGLRANGEVGGLSAAGLPLGDYLWRADAGSGVGSGRSLTSEFSGGNDRFKIKGQASLDLNERGYRYTAEMRSDESSLIGMLKSKARKAEAGKLTFSGEGKLGSKAQDKRRGAPRSKPQSKP